MSEGMGRVDLCMGQMKNERSAHKERVTRSDGFGMMIAENNVNTTDIASSDLQGRLRVMKRLSNYNMPLFILYPNVPDSTFPRDYYIILTLLPFP